MNKHTTWAIALVIITLTICGTLIYLNENAWTIRFEMDDNTKEAIQSIEWESLPVAGTEVRTALYYDIDDNKTIFLESLSEKVEEKK